MEQFLAAYMRNLIVVKNKFPDQYKWENKDVLEVFRSMSEAFKAGTYSRYCKAIKLTCKELDIPYTREGIDLIFKTETKGENNVAP